MIEIKVCQICGSDAKFMKDSKTHCNCLNKDCLLSGDKYFHVDKWNKRSSESMRLIDIIEDLRLEVTASIDSREQGYIDDLFRKATDALISSSTVSVPSAQEILELSNYPEEPNSKNMNENLVWDYKLRLDKIHDLLVHGKDSQ